MPPPADDPSSHVQFRHHGRLYTAEVRPNGSTTIARDGLFLVNAHWNGRALDTGDHELHTDLDTSNEILEALAAEILKTPAATPFTRPGKDAYPNR